MLRFCFTLLLLLGLSLPIYAHRAPESFTTISWNDRSRHFEITHRIHQHDAQALLNRMQEGYEDLASLKARARITLLITESFSLLNTQGEAIVLTTLGAELEADYILVFQEFEKPEQAKVDVHFGWHQVLPAAHISVLSLPQMQDKNVYRFDAHFNTQTIQLY